jgi:hypothetical protein
MFCPSRGRPGNIAELRDAWDAVTDPGEARLLVAVDDDDPELPAYLAGGPVQVLHGVRGLGPVLNALAAQYAPQYAFTGFLGDDHRPRTPGWAGRLTAALGSGPGVAYGNDLLRGAELPTAVVISSPLVTGLGYMAPPGPEHLYLDAFWKLLGEATRLEYLQDVTIEHCHPSAGKAAWDAGYARVNSAARDERDRAAYQRFLEAAWPDDRARIS